MVQWQRAVDNVSLPQLEKTVDSCSILNEPACVYTQGYLVYVGSVHVVRNEVVKPSVVNGAGFGKTSGTGCVDVAHLVYHEQNKNHLEFVRYTPATVETYPQMIFWVEVVVDGGRMILASPPGTWRVGGPTLHAPSNSYT